MTNTLQTQKQFTWLQIMCKNVKNHPHGLSVHLYVSMRACVWQGQGGIISLRDSVCVYGVKV